jgi:mono/diheme cytochrome c family protein
MNHFSVFKPRVLVGIGLAVTGAAIYTLSIPNVDGGPQAAPQKPAESNSLSGATLYAINCSRCHQERYPTEFTAASWKTIMMHMRVRANLPAAQAKEILKYLQEDAGN